MTHDPQTPCSAFAGNRKITQGPLHQLARALPKDGSALVFSDLTGQVIDIDPRGYPEPPSPKRGPGRPKLGVIPREVTLLQRHWDWLGQQPGGASAALRRLVDAARRADGGETDARAAREAAYRFVQALAGDLEGFEEATRALFAGDLEGFAARMAGWPADLRQHALRLATPAAGDGPGTTP
jgi:hypothetical protein